MLSISSPAKINLFLHVTGNRNDGYHLLDSLVAFAYGVEDRISITAADEFSLAITGPFASQLKDEDTSNNLVARAAREFSTLIEHDLKCAITLEKNIPAGAGLGGGSGDAAATIKGLEKYWGVTADRNKLAPLLLNLGADVPVCYLGQTSHLGGIGETITKLNALPPLRILLIWPGVASNTKEVFRHFKGPYSPAVTIPNFSDAHSLINFLKTTKNDLKVTAQKLCPAIEDAYLAVKNSSGCLFAQMTGSGSCVFGLFNDEASCTAVVNDLSKQHTAWWISQGRLA